MFSVMTIGDENVSQLIAFLGFQVNQESINDVKIMMLITHHFDVLKLK